jgi:hypothetical protein
MPKEKELHYFDEKTKNKSSLADRLRGERAMDQRWRRQVKRQIGRYRQSFKLRNVAWDLNYFLRPYNDRWYASLFRQGRGRITGEITPSYSILDRETVVHVHALAPEAKIIFMMRNPIERAWSQAVMRLTNKDYAVDETSVERFHRGFGRRGSELRTDYQRTLENWGSFFPEEQIFIGFLEDISLHPEELLEDVYGFLGVDPSFRPTAWGERVNSTSVGEMPTSIAVYLARSYLEDLESLSERFGGYASFWLYCARRLIEGPPKEESIPYPFWETLLWEEWDGPKTGYCSGPLSTLRTTG